MFLFLSVSQLFGCGSVAQTVLSRGAQGEPLTIHIGFTMGVMMAVYMAGGVSGKRCRTRTRHGPHETPQAPSDPGPGPSCRLCLCKAAVRCSVIINTDTLASRYECHSPGKQGRRGKLETKVRSRSLSDSLFAQRG